MPGLLDSLPSIQPTPRQNKVLGLLADALYKADAFARKPFGYDNPPVQMALDAVGAPGLLRTIDRLSYGEPLTTGKGQTTRLRDDTVDALGFVPLSPRTAAAVVSGGLSHAPGVSHAIFAGVKANTSDKAALKAARAMEAKGADPRAIWSETGWFKGGDGLWRFEIDDSKAANLFTRPSMEEMRDINGGKWIKGDDFMREHWRTPEAERMRVRNSMQSEQLTQYNPTAGQTISHPELFAAYPDAADVRTVMSNKMPIGEAGYAEAQDAVILSPVQGEQATNLALHELQHAIQVREGFARGGSPEIMPELLAQSAAAKRAEAQRLNGIAFRNDPLSTLEVLKPGARARALELDRQAQSLQQWVSRMNEFGDNFAFDAYNRLAGEAEARAVQKRMGMTPAERRAVFPLDSYDVPIGQLIYR